MVNFLFFLFFFLFRWGFVLQKTKMFRTKKEAAGLLVYTVDKQEELVALFELCRSHSSSPDVKYNQRAEAIVSVQQTFPVFPVRSRCRQWSITTITAQQLPFIFYRRPADQPFLKKKNRSILSTKKGQTNINKCIRTRLNVQCRRCPNHKMFEEGTKATWSCVFTMLCVSVDAVKNKKTKGELFV